jgi:hypothetical protein
MVADARAPTHVDPMNSRHNMMRVPIMTCGVHILVTVLFATGCHRVVTLNGDYKIVFTFADGKIESATVTLANNDEAVSESGREVILEKATPILQEQIKKANLRQASGRLVLTVYGTPPYFVQVREFHITHPSFEDLYAAVQHEEVQKIRQIVAEDRNVDQRELPCQQTALGVAAAGAYLDSLRTLLELRADPNIPNNIGVTPLMAAVTNGSESAVRMLMNAGASPSSVNSAGESALSLAKKLHRDNLVPILQRSGAA